MKITKIDVFQFRCEVAIPNKPVGCRIYTDEGIYGDGVALKEDDRPARNEDDNDGGKWFHRK